MSLGYQSDRLSRLWCSRRQVEGAQIFQGTKKIQGAQIVHLLQPAKKTTFSVWYRMKFEIKVYDRLRDITWITPGRKSSNRRSAHFTLWPLFRERKTNYNKWRDHHARNLNISLVFNFLREVFSWSFWAHSEAFWRCSGNKNWTDSLEETFCRVITFLKKFLREDQREILFSRWFLWARLREDLRRDLSAVWAGESVKEI